MAQLPFARGTYRRQVAKTPLIPMHNRFIEGVPTLTDGQVSAIARPAMRRMTSVGTGPVRGVFTAPGIFGDKAFVVSGTEFYSIDPLTGMGTLITTISTDPLGSVSWAPVAQIEDQVPSRLFFAEGNILWLYMENSPALGLLEATGVITNGNTVRLGDVYYQITNGSVDAGTPAGTAANPWRIKLEVSAADTVRNLFFAINGDEGEPGTQYSTATTPHPDVRGYTYTAAELFVAAVTAGTGGNAIATTQTGTGLVWSAATLQNGGTTRIRQVYVPGDVGAISVCAINGYVIVIPVQDEALGTVGKFFWIEPGDDFIDPLNFANAERSSDVIHQAITFSDQYWLFGRESTEPWITTGDPDAPMQRYQGILFDRGTWPGTAVKVRDSMILVDEEGGVFMIKGGLERISRPDIEERIRRAIQEEGIL